MTKNLINTADLKELIQSDNTIQATAKGVESVDGYLLHLKSKNKEMVLSTYLSDKPRLFKRPEALLKEATNIGLKTVIFELDQ